MTTLPKQDLDAGIALGNLLTIAIEHLIDTGKCCPQCCRSCSTLMYYRDEQSVVVDTGVMLALDNRDTLPDWLHEQYGQLIVNWRYLNLFWPEADGQHLDTCTP